MALSREEELRLEAIISKEIEAGPPPPPYSAGRIIFNQAVSFHAGALRCGEHIPLPDGGSQSCTSPSIVLYAFSIELYFKAIMHDEGGASTGHRLSKLFRQLPVAVQDCVASTYTAITVRNAEEFLSDLDILSDTFVEWRYIYEKGRRGIAVGRLASIARATYLTAVSFKPAWKSADHLDQLIRSDPPSDVTRIISFGDGRIMRVEVIEH